MQECKRCGFDPQVREIWRRAWKPSLYSYLEDPIDREAWQAMVHTQCCRVRHDCSNLACTHEFTLVKREMSRVNIDILGIRELKQMGIGEFNSDYHYIYHPLEQPSQLTKEAEIQYLGAISKVTERSQFISKANHSTSQ